MPNYKTHDTIGFVSIIPIVSTSLYLQYSLYDIAVLAIGIAFGTYFLSPDLDLHSRIYMRWGLFRWIWIPYQKLIPHRSWVSHSGPISATLRLLYLSLWCLPVIITLNLHFQSFYVILWIAFMIADTLHVLMDILWTWIKKGMK